MKISVLMPIYINDQPVHVKAAIDSILNQTYKPSEITIILDGPVKKGVQELINQYKLNNKDLFQVISFKVNKGLGEALKIGVYACRYPYIARMDADDIARNDRLEKQIKIFRSNPKVDIVGSYISEFVDTILEPVSVRKVPTKHDEIIKFAKRRNPFNHMTIMFKKEKVLGSGNYASFQYLEDYFLWIRMLNDGCIGCNIPETLVYARVGNGMYKRRGGLKYLLYELKLQKYALKIGFLNKKDFFLNMIYRTIVRLCPEFLREKIYIKLLR